MNTAALCVDWFFLVFLWFYEAKLSNAQRDLTPQSLIWKCSELLAVSSWDAKTHSLFCVSSFCAFSNTRLCAINENMRSKVAAEQNRTILWREMGELCRVHGRASAEKWAAEKYCFSKGAKRKAQGRQMRKGLAYLPLPNTQICSKEEAHHWQSPYLSLLSILSFPSWRLPREDMCVSMCVLLWVLTKDTLVFWAFQSLPGLYKVQRNEQDVGSGAAVQYEDPIPVSLNNINNTELLGGKGGGTSGKVKGKRKHIHTRIHVTLPQKKVMISSNYIPPIFPRMQLQQRVAVAQSNWHCPDLTGGTSERWGLSHTASDCHDK